MTGQRTQHATAAELRAAQTEIDSLRTREAEAEAFYERLEAELHRIAGRFPAEGYPDGNVEWSLCQAGPVAALEQIAYLIGKQQDELRAVREIVEASPTIKQLRALADWIDQHDDGRQYTGRATRSRTSALWPTLLTPTAELPPPTRERGLSVGDKSAIEWSTEATKRCSHCREIKPTTAFARDRSRADGLTYWCRACRNSRQRGRYASLATGAPSGPAPLPERDSDARQARRTVDHLVETEQIPHPNDLPCADCGHIWRPGERRYEHDHHLGHGAGHHRDVEASAPMPLPARGTEEGGCLMGDRTRIEWSEATWNPPPRCDRISPGCDHCYALTLAKRLKAMGQPKYQTDGKPPTSGPGFGLAMHLDTLIEPLKWREPRLVFVNSMSDPSVGVRVPAL